MKTAQLRNRLRQLADPAIAAHSRRFFKCAPGEYAAGDRFLGIRAPKLRALTKEFRAMPVNESLRLLRSPYHEERLCALLLLVQSFTGGDTETREIIAQGYLENLRYINNWDLVDSSAPQILGAYLADKPKRPLYELAASKELWARRTAIMATFHFIRQQHFHTTLDLAKQLLQDNEDLIHKAVGWMLREIGKRDGKLERAFLDKHCRTMPRTMLRYAIEKFPATERKRYLASKA